MLISERVEWPLIELHLSLRCAGELDPWEAAVRKSQGLDDIEEAAARELERREAKRERGTIEYPDVSDFDPYDPTTFGFVEVGQILGAHGVKGEMKVS